MSRVGERCARSAMTPLSKWLCAGEYPAGRRALTGPERAAVDSYLSEKYGLYRTGATWITGYSAPCRRASTPANGTKSFTYDAKGNTLSDGDRNYTWDALGQLVAINYVTGANAGGRTEFIYKEW